MLLIFPLIYILSFLISCYYLVTKRVGNILLFVVFGLPLYITSLSITFMYGLRQLIPVMQSFKELLILGTLVLLVVTMRKRFRFHLMDYLVLFYFCYNLLYVLLPAGGFSFMERALAFKGISFFPFIYFTGRLINFQKVNLNKFYHFICLFSILASAVLLFEVIPYVHLQTYTGYADYNFYYFNMEPAGNYGLTWTFEIENGLKRFASFFSTPLELAASALVTTSVMVAIITGEKGIKWTPITGLTFLSTMFSIAFALSRASFAGYLIMLYVYAWVSRRWLWLRIFHYGLALMVVFAILWMNEDLFEFIINTFTFTNSSSITHLIEWIEGINAIINYPLGMGLGTSGKVSGTLGLNIGGENQAIIIGVQTGIIALGLYLAIYGYLIFISARTYRHSKGKARKLGLALLLLKVGLIVPAITSEIESYIYISYLSWLFSGLLISMVSRERRAFSAISSCQSKSSLE